MALSKAAKEIMLVTQLLESMGIKLKYPIIVLVDNTSAVFMSNNVTTTSHNKKVDTCYRYVNEYVEDGIKMIFVKS